MGHKVNSLIFRSKNFPYYFNLWNSFISIYKNIKYVLNIQIFVKNKKQLNILYVQSNYINKNYCVYNIILFSKSIFIKHKEDIKISFSEFIKKNYFTHIKFGFNFVILKHPLVSTNFLLKYIYNKLLYTNSSLRKIIPQLILLINTKYKIKGLKCIISGRINGVQMAKLETFKFNECSLQSKTLNIKYSFLSIPTKYGLLGIKIWLFLI